MNDESRAFWEFLQKSFEFPKSSSIEMIRPRIEEQHTKINEEFIGIFKGVEEEKIVKTSTAGKMRRSILAKYL
jgi:hypothetical protein